MISGAIYYKIEEQKESERQLETIIYGKKIHYDVEGEGYPVILLHGWLASSKTMQPLANGLKQKFKVYNLDIIGFGESELPDNPMTTNDFGDFLKEFINKIEEQNPILIGHSNGGRMIINAVRKRNN